MAKKPSNLLYSVAEHPPFWTTIGLGVQHAFVTAMLLVLPVIVVQEMSGTPAQAQNMIRWSLVAGGTGAILQALYRGPVGFWVSLPATVRPGVSLSLCAGCQERWPVSGVWYDAPGWGV
jgi:xanthine/uracil permease